GAAHAVTDRVRVQVSEAASDAVGAEQLAAVGDGEQTGPFGDTEGGSEVGWPAASLVAGQPEARHAMVGVAYRQPCHGSRVERVPRPVGREYHSDADARRARGCRRGVQAQLDDRGQPAEPAGVAARIDLELQPPGAL